MKVEKLELKNFRSHQRTEFALDRINVVRGHHGVGKSSIAYALEFLLTGACDVTDAAGRGADSLLQHGADEFGVRGSISLTERAGSPGAVIMRSRNKAGGTFMITASGKGKAKNLVARQAEAWMDEYLGPKPVLSAVLNSQRFLQMAEAERKKLLTMALAADPVPLPEEIVADLRKLEFTEVALLDGPGGTKEIGDAQHCQQVYDKLYGRRREINALVRDMGELAEPEKPAGMPTAAATRQKLEECRSALQKLETSRANMISGRAQDEERLRQAVDDKKEYEPQLLTTEQMERLTRIAGKKRQAEELDTEITRKQVEIEGLERELKKLKAAPDNCHACGQKLPKVDSTDLINNTEHRLEIAERELGELREKRQPLGDPAEAERKLQDHRRAVPRVGAAERVISELKPKLDAAGQVDTSEIDREIEQQRERIRRGEQVLAQVHKFEGQLQAYEQQKAERAKLEERQKIAQRLVEYFGPDGELRSKLVGDKLAGFTARINDTLKRFNFFCELSLEPFSVQVSAINNSQGAASYRPLFLHQLSESEAFRFGVAFQIALAEATHVGVVIIDRADILLPSVRQFLNRALSESKLDQAFILAATEAMPVMENLPAGVRFFDLAKDEQGHTQISATYAAEKETEYASE
jgi:DNA repair exonuclease SbcCD ATPase subunit